MRNLKKVLSLVLVVAMLASMLIVGAAAAEAEETTNYPEAVEVMIGIGLIEGDESGYRFGDTVTREEAAKIICYALLGDTAETLPLTSSPFADVAAGRWSAGYIAYLKGQGVISGVTDTTYDPTAEVTGVAFAKMMLVAAGYGKNGEYEGADWDINTITYANQLGLFAGTKAADLTAPATREECMLYAFNTMTGIPTVSYNKTFEAYYTGTSALDPVTGDVIPTEVTAEDPYAYTLAWKNFGLKQITTGNTDDFGRPAASWTANGVVVAEAVANIEPDAVLYGSVYSTNLYNTLGKSVVKNLNGRLTATKDSPASITLYVDGVESTVTNDGKDGWIEIVAGEYMNKVGGTGATVELYLSQSTTSGDYYLDIVVWYEHLGEVTRVNTTGGVTTLTIKDVLGETVTVSSEELDVSGFAKKDMVKYTRGTVGADGKVISVASLEESVPVVATYTGENTSYGYKTLDGAAYYASGRGTVADINVYGNSYSLYLDSFGNILFAELYEEGEAVNQYVYVTGADAQAYTPENILDGNNAAVAVSVVYPNGGKDVLYYAVKTDSFYNLSNEKNKDEELTNNVKSTEYYITYQGVDYVIVADDYLCKVDENDGFNPEDKAKVTDVIGNGWVRYTMNDEGYATLKVLNPSYAEVPTEKISVENNRATVTGTDYTANSTTVLTLVDSEGNAATYTGIKNFVDEDGAAGKALITYGYSSKIAKTITIFVDKVTSQLNLAFCFGAGETTDEGTVVTFFVDGGMLSITLDPDDAKYMMYGWVYTIELSGGDYVVEPVGYYGTTPETKDAGVVNAGWTMYHGGAANKVYYANYVSTTLSYEYYEWATIDRIDDGYFTTVAVTDEEAEEKAEGLATMEQDLATMKATLESNYGTDPDEWADDDEEEAIVLNGQIEALEAEILKVKKEIADLCSDSVAGQPVPANTYYYDANTIVYDMTFSGATEIAEGDVFVAYVDEDASATYNGAQYVSHIWIVA